MESSSSAAFSTATTKYVRKQSDTQCCICCENIEYYAIGECGHNVVCWQCSLRQRMKMLKKECMYCKVINYRVLITKNKYDTLETCHQSIYDPDTDVSFQNPSVKIEITRKLGNICQLCHTEPIRKFPSQQSLCKHYEQQHQKTFCQLCIEYKPVLMFQQELYDFQQIGQHKKKTHPFCHFCYNKDFYD